MIWPFERYMRRQFRKSTQDHAALIASLERAYRKMKGLPRGDAMRLEVAGPSGHRATSARPGFGRPFRAWWR